MKLFLSAGIPRSGSTWLFNAMRLLLLGVAPDLESGWVDDEDLIRSQKTRLIKLHHPDPQLIHKADFVAISHRDLRDILCSLESVGWITDIRPMEYWARTVRRQHEVWAQFANIDLAYEDIISSPDDVLVRLDRAIRQRSGMPESSAETLTTIASELQTLRQSASKSEHDPITLLHWNHQTDGRSGRWRSQLDPHVAQQVWATHREWLEAQGYKA